MIYEVWKTIPRTDGMFEASNAGRIRSLLRLSVTGSPRILSLCNDGKDNPYKFVGLKLNGRRVNRGVHQCVMAAFHGWPETRLDVNHLNGNKTDNRLANLEYATRSQNMVHACLTGLSKPPVFTGRALLNLPGEQCPNSKIKEALAIQIISMAKAGYSAATIARAQGTTWKIAKDIAKGRTWKHLPR